MRSTVQQVIRLAGRVGFAMAISCLAAAGATADVRALESEFAALQARDADGQSWFDFAVRAREEDALPIAHRALAKAADAGFSSIRTGVEKARLLVAGGDKPAAITQVRSLYDQGFTSVSVFTSDPVIGSLAGEPAYDELISEMSIQAYPCSHQQRFSEFDFWVGEWDVALANGTPAGSNLIERQERGCMLVEHWTSATGGTGSSINYVDGITGEWVQIWNSEGGSQINIRGGLTDEGMALEGTIFYVANGTSAPFKGLWTPLEDGRVRQYFEQSNDGGKTWVPWFEGFYTRKQ